MTTFADLGVPFPLFEAPITEASDYVGLSSCRLCDGRDRHCFDLGIGDAVVLPCPACGVDNGLDAQGRKDAPCRACDSTVPFPESLGHKKSFHICHACLRAGRAAMTKDTEFGMVSWDQAFQGITHGVPGLRTSEFELVPIDPADDWYGVRVPQEHLFEVLRTPAFNTWQGERWLFRCQRPMTYIGEWANVLKLPGRPDDPRAFIEAVIDPADESKGWLREAIFEGSGGVRLYVLRCQTCGRFRSTWDMD